MKYVTFLVFIWNKIAWKCFRVVGLLFFFFPCSPGESLFIISKKIKKVRNKNPRGVVWILFFVLKNGAVNTKASLGFLSTFTWDLELTFCRPE